MGSTEKDDKAQRLAAALRDNLLRRKAQARQMGEPVAKPNPDSDP